MSMHIHITNQPNEFGMFIKAACFSLLPNARTSETFGTHNVYICKLSTGKKKNRECVEEKQNEQIKMKEHRCPNKRLEHCVMQVIGSNQVVRMRAMRLQMMVFYPIFHYTFVSIQNDNFTVE